MSHRIEALDVHACTIPTDGIESDGTLEWDSTTIVIVEARAAGVSGIGYSYTHAVAASLIRDQLAPLLIGTPTMDVPAAWESMRAAVRNLGRSGLASTAISAVDTALWDLKARILDLPLADLLGNVRDTVPIYGSGGFTSYSLDRLTRQLAGWVQTGIKRVKMKVAREPAVDTARVAAVREAIGPDADLYVDANGAWSRKQALRFAAEFAAYGVTWCEEPVSSDDLAGVRLIRDRAPPGMDIAAGEYGYDLFQFRRILEAGAVDVLQADVTRCGGITELLRVGALCAAHNIPLSAHTAPALHVHAACAIPAMRHVEYFHDHVRIERLLFDGLLEPANGTLRPDRGRAGNGLVLKKAELVRYAS